MRNFSIVALVATIIIGLAAVAQAQSQSQSQWATGTVAGSGNLDKYGVWNTQAAFGPAKTINELYIAGSGSITANNGFGTGANWYFNNVYLTPDTLDRLSGFSRGGNNKTVHVGTVWLSVGEMDAFTPTIGSLPAGLTKFGKDAGVVTLKNNSIKLDDGPEQIGWGTNGGNGTALWQSGPSFGVKVVEGGTLGTLNYSGGKVDNDGTINTLNINGQAVASANTWGNIGELNFGAGSGLLIGTSFEEGKFAGFNSSIKADNVNLANANLSLDLTGFGFDLTDDFDVPALLKEFFGLVGDDGDNALTLTWASIFGTNNVDTTDLASIELDFGVNLGDGFDPFVFTLDNDWAVNGVKLAFLADGSGVKFTSDVPEPATLAMLGLGLVGLGLARRRK